MNWDRDDSPNLVPLGVVLSLALLGGAAAIALFPKPEPAEGEGTVVWIKSNASREKGGRQSVAQVELPDGRDVLAVLPASAGRCEEGSRVTLVKEGIRSVIAPGSCSKP